MRFLPNALIMLNNDLVPEIIQVVQTQLKITDTYLDGYSFDQIVAADPNYLQTVQRLNKRVLVLRNFQDFTNRNLFNIVAFVYQGLLQIESNNLGPHKNSFPVVNLSWGLLGVY